MFSVYEWSEVDSKEGTYRNRYYQWKEVMHEEWICLCRCYYSSKTMSRILMHWVNSFFLGMYSLQQNWQQMKDHQDHTMVFLFDLIMLNIVLENDRCRPRYEKEISNLWLISYFWRIMNDNEHNDHRFTYFLSLTSKIIVLTSILFSY
jgi:hypothetical protein